MKNSKETETDIMRYDIPINKMNSIVKAKRAPAVRLTRTGKGSTSGNRVLSTKQVKIADEFYAQARALATN